MGFARRAFIPALAGILPALMGGITNLRQISLNPFLEFEPLTPLQSKRIVTSFGSGNYSRPSRMQVHSGAGGTGAHRRWRKRRAAGIYH